MTRGPVLRRDYALAAAAMVAVIVHGSLYPYDFRPRPGPVGAIDTLLGSWAVPPTGLGDLIANILLYVPFGLFATLALRPAGRRGRAGVTLAGVTLAGALLCTGIELLQFYDAGRVTNMSDVYLNTFGTALGAGGAVLAGVGSGLPLRRQVFASPAASLMLASFLGYRLYPYVPTIDLHKYWTAVRPVLLDPQVAPYALGRYFALWLAASWLLGVIVGARRSLLAVPLAMAAVFAGKVVIETQALSAAELAGAAAGLAAWAVLAGRPGLQAPLVAAVLGAMVVAQRLEPFAFDPLPRAFGWMPFHSYLHGSMAVNTVSFMEKVFHYGTLLLLLARAGVRPGIAAASVAGLMLATSYGQTYLPGRSAEITDTVMVLLLAGVIQALDAPGAGRAARAAMARP